jgi:CopG family nickel-responsive transcriptional regulator
VIYVPGKRRFGISVTESVADAFDMLSKILGVDRSMLIEEALRSYLDDHRHLLIPHECRGVVAAVCHDNREVAEVVRKYKNLVAGHFHIHLDGFCLDVFVVRGDSREIGRLIGSLKSLGCRARYLPVREAEKRL